MAVEKDMLVMSLNDFTEALNGETFNDWFEARDWMQYDEKTNEYYGDEVIAQLQDQLRFALGSFEEVMNDGRYEMQVGVLPHGEVSMLPVVYDTQDGKYLHISELESVVQELIPDALTYTTPNSFYDEYGKETEHQAALGIGKGSAELYVDVAESLLSSYQDTSVSFGTYVSETRQAIGKTMEDYKLVNPLIRQRAEDYLNDSENKERYSSRGTVPDFEIYARLNTAYIGEPKYISTSKGEAMQTRLSIQGGITSEMYERAEDVCGQKFMTDSRHLAKNSEISRNERLWANGNPLNYSQEQERAYKAAGEANKRDKELYAVFYEDGAVSLQIGRRIVPMLNEDEQAMLRSRFENYLENSKSDLQKFFESTAEFGEVQLTTAQGGKEIRAEIFGNDDFLREMDMHMLDSDTFAFDKEYQFFAAITEYGSVGIHAVYDGKEEWVGHITDRERRALKDAFEHSLGMDYQQTAEQLERKENAMNQDLNLKAAEFARIAPEEHDFFKVYPAHKDIVTAIERTGLDLKDMGGYESIEAMLDDDNFAYEFYATTDGELRFAAFEYVIDVSVPLNESEMEYIRRQVDALEGKQENTKKPRDVER